MGIFGKVERAIAIALLALMAIVVISGVLEVAYVIFTDLMQPPGFFLGVEDLFDIFGLFLMLLIGLELISSPSPPWRGKSSFSTRSQLTR
jgi:uncharacterized membrane protein (DUF373 family)